MDLEGLDTRSLLMRDRVKAGSVMMANAREDETLLGIVMNK